MTGKPTETAMPPTGVYYISVGKERERVVVKREALDVGALKEERQGIEERLKAIPGEPDDKTLLAWAREHYPRMDYSAERAALETRLSEIVTALGE